MKLGNAYSVRVRGSGYLGKVQRSEKRYECRYITDTNTSGSEAGDGRLVSE